MTRLTDRLPEAFFALVVAVIILGGAWAIWRELTEPESGTVTSKQYHPESTTLSCTTAGSVTTCIPTTYDECYEITYTNGKRNGDACVSPREYELYEIGSQYPRGQG